MKTRFFTANKIKLVFACLAFCVFNANASMAINFPMNILLKVAIGAR